MYVALGDSFSSGEGAPAVVKDSAGRDHDLFIAGTSDPGNHCHRSTEAYPVEVWRQLGPGWSLQFTACSGAKIGNFDLKQDGQPPQKEAFAHGADLVTISMGGNDAGFSTILKSCVIRGAVDRKPCKPGYERVIDAALLDLSAGLPGLYSRLRQSANPGARVIVLGYPRFFPVDPPGSCSTGAAGSFLRGDMQWLNYSVLRANALIAESAAKAGVSYVDVTDLFLSGGERHDLCIDSGARRWINRMIPSHQEWSFHPKAVAHEAEARLVAACVKDPSTCKPRQPSPLATVKWPTVLADLRCGYVHPPTGSAIAIRSTSFADVNGDRILDAFVVAACESPTSSNPEEVHIFDGASDPARPRRFGRLLKDDPAYVRHVAVSVRNRTVTVDGNALKEGSALCCPDLSFSQSFSWDGRTFKAGPRTLAPLKTTESESPNGNGLTGDQYALLTAVDPARGVVTFDVIQWFRGRQAQQACQEDGVVSHDAWCTDFYYRNTNTLVRIMPVAPGAPITTYGRSDPDRLEPTTLAAVAAKVDRDLKGPYKLTISANTVTAMEEVFIP